MSEYKKCSVADGILEPCVSLNRAMDYGTKKGITLLEVYDFKEQKTSRTMAVLRSGDFVKNGIVINYCPFCGNSIADHVHTKSE